MARIRDVVRNHIDAIRASDDARLCDPDVVVFRPNCTLRGVGEITPLYPPIPLVGVDQYGKRYQSGPMLRPLELVCEQYYDEKYAYVIWREGPDGSYRVAVYHVDVVAGKILMQSTFSADYVPPPPEDWTMSLSGTHAAETKAAIVSHPAGVETGDLERIALDYADDAVDFDPDSCTFLKGAKSIAQAYLEYMYKPFIADGHTHEEWVEAVRSMEIVHEDVVDEYAYQIWTANGFKPEYIATTYHVHAGKILMQAPSFTTHWQPPQPA